MKETDIYLKIPTETPFQKAERNMVMFLHEIALRDRNKADFEKYAKKTKNIIQQCLNEMDTEDKIKFVEKFSFLANL